MPNNNQNPNNSLPAQSPRHLLTCFPSGLTVASARLEAEKRLTQGQAETMVQALNHVAMRELGLRWDDAMHRLQEIQQDKIGSNITQNNNAEQPIDTENKKKRGNTFLTNYDVAQHIVGHPKNFVKKSKLPQAMTPSKVKELLSQYPDIGYDGFCDQVSSAHRAEQRASLSMALNSFSLAMQFLSQCDAIKSINKKLTASKLAEIFSDIAFNKHLINKENANLISVGAVIICAYELGFESMRTKEGICFNISSRSKVFKNAS